MVPAVLDIYGLRRSLYALGDDKLNGVVVVGEIQRKATESNGRDVFALIRSLRCSPYSTRKCNPRVGFSKVLRNTTTKMLMGIRPIRNPVTVASTSPMGRLSASQALLGPELFAKVRDTPVLVVGAGGIGSELRKSRE